MCLRPIDEADIEQQRRREAARLYRDRHHISNDDTISNFEDLGVFGGSLETVEQVSEVHAVDHIASYCRRLHFSHMTQLQHLFIPQHSGKLTICLLQCRGNVMTP